MATRKPPAAARKEAPTFRQEMMRSILTEPLLSIVMERLKPGRGKAKAAAEEPLEVIFTLNNQYPTGLGAAKRELQQT